MGNFNVILTQCFCWYFVQFCFN
uniref:Uncharacterized protein n=1 Tax=Anguilla anguilla TaxID=7936 RepID=A0A0E9TWG4_ANGAN